MSTFIGHHVTCPSCGHAWHVEIAQGLHITRLPNVREQLRAGTFQVFACPACQAPTAFESALVYTDFDRHEYVALEIMTTASWRAAIARHETVFRNCFDCGPPLVRTWASRFKRRIVYGFAALREKLLLWDAGLDDRVVEAVKGDLLRSHEARPRTVMLRLSQILDGGHLLFSVYESTRGSLHHSLGQPPITETARRRDIWTAPRDMIDRRRAAAAQVTADYPWLLDDWLIDIHDGPSYLYTP